MLDVLDRGRLHVLHTLAALFAANEDRGAHVIAPFRSFALPSPFEQGRISSGIFDGAGESLRFTVRHFAVNHGILGLLPIAIRAASWT